MSNIQQSNHSDNNKKQQQLTISITQMFGDLKTNTKHKQSLNKVMDFVNELTTHYQWISTNNHKLAMINLQNNDNKVPLKQLFYRSGIKKEDYDQQKVLITKGYMAKSILRQQQSRQTNLLNNINLNVKNSLNPSSNIVSQQVILVHYANRMHVLKHNHSQNDMVLQKSHIVTAPTLPINNTSFITIQPLSTYNNPTNSNPLSSSLSPSSPYKLSQLNYEHLLNKLKQCQQSYQQIIQFKTKFYQDDNESKLKLYQIHLRLKSILQELLAVWHVKQAVFRVAVINDYNPIVLNKSSLQPVPNIYIYQPFQVFYTNKNSPTFNIALNPTVNLSLQTTTSPENLLLSIRLIKQLLLYQLISTKHQPVLRKFKQFQNKLQTQLYQSLKEKQRLAEKQKNIKLENIRNTDSLRNYQNLQIKSFFLQWNKKLKSQSSTKTPYISLQLNSMYLVDQYKYIRMKCELFISFIDRKNKQYQSNTQIKYFTFLFDENTEDWNVKLVPQDNERGNKRNILFDLSKVRDFFNIMVKITPQDKKGSSLINGLCTVSKREKFHGFGDNQQLVLYQQDKMGNQRIVGFLKLFYLVKDYYDINKALTFDLQKYRNIKTLQTMPRMPGNYFQHTLLNYNPNNIKLFGQMLGQKTNIVSRLNFQHVYLKLIDFLQSERMDLRRQSLIIMSEMDNGGSKQKGGSKIKGIEGKQRRFMPYQRMNEYQNILRIRLSREIVNSYNGIHNTHWINSLNKITKSSLAQQQKLQDSDLIGEFMYIRVSDDQLSMKTSLIINESLKQSLYQSQVLFVNNAHVQTMGVMSTLFALNQNSVCEYKGSIYRTSNGKQMRRVRLQKSLSKFNSIQTFNPYMVPLVNRLITLYRHHLLLQQQSQQKSVSLQKQTTIVTSSYQQPIDQSKLVQFVVNFLNAVYPYSQPKALQRELMYVRYFVAKYLPQVNYQLNRKNIGLENFVSKYFLSLFTLDLQEQVTFQIWDFIILSTNKFAARINSVLTLLIFMQKNNFSPIIPLDTFVTALKQNYNRFDFSYNAKKVSQLMISSLGEFYQKEHHRKSQLSKMKDGNGRLLIGDQFVKKVLFDTDRLNKVTYQKNKVNLNDLNYKLPQPKYYGHPVQQIQLLIRNFSITQTVSLQNWTLLTKWHNQSFSMKINQKSQILNSYVKFQYPKYLLQNLHDMPHLEFIILPVDEERRYFMGCLPMMGLHKDSVYCQQVKVVYVKDGQIMGNNKGENVINVQLILKSQQNRHFTDKLANSRAINNMNNTIMNRSSFVSIKDTQNIPITTTIINLGLQRQYFALTKTRLQKIYSSLLDYDIQQQNNSALSSIIELRKQLIRMKNPIDQFSKQKYEKVKILPVGDCTFPQVVMNSQLLIQELQALIESFNDERMRTFIPALYKLYSQQTNYQMVFLTEILIQAILIDNTISFQTKIEYLYLVGKHYQNCYSKGLTSQTVDFIFQYIYKTYAWLNPVPYTKENKGMIIKALIYTKGVKNSEDILDFTQILQDFTHVNKIKYGQFSLVLGNAQFLTQLSELLPLQTLQMLEKQKNKDIKVEITYKKNSSQYLYTANVNLLDFRITQQGGKFLSKHTVSRDLNAGKVWVHHQYCANKDKLYCNYKLCQSQCHQTTIQLDTSSEILYNCSNIISLQSPCTFDRTAFRKAIYTTPMISYLLNYSSLYQPIQQQLNKKMVIPRSPVIVNEQIQLREYTDWVLYRYQYCQEQWRKCKVERIQNDTVQVEFPYNQLKTQSDIKELLVTKYKQKVSDNIYCKAPAFQVWSMEENLVDNSQQTQSTVNEEWRRNKKSAMNKISSKYQSFK